MIPTWIPVDLCISQAARCSDAGKEERRWRSSEVGSKKDGGFGGVAGVSGVSGVLFLSFFLFLYHMFVDFKNLRYKNLRGALAMA